jgi:pyruvate carboxylase
MAMPGLIVGVAVQAGQRVERDDRLFTIEAMKMETAVYAETSAVVKEVVIEAGHRVDAHDLVIVLETA